MKENRSEKPLPGTSLHDSHHAISEFKFQLIGGGERSFHYRNNHSSDRDVIRQIFVNRDYDLTPFQQTQYLKRFASTPEHQQKKLLVIDAGANIGASAVYFTQIDRRIHVCAIEPEESNFELLELNCAGMPVNTIRALATGAIVSVQLAVSLK